MELMAFTNWNIAISHNLVPCLYKWVNDPVGAVLMESRLR